MNLHLNEKVIIVIGGTNEIGACVCKKLAEEGAIACILDDNEKNMQKVVSEIKEKFGIEPFSVFTQFKEPSSWKSSINEILFKFKRIDGVVNNIATKNSLSLQNENFEEFISSIDKTTENYSSVLDYILPALKKSLGSIVNICPKTHITGQGGTYSYAYANDPKIAITSQWANQLSSFGINVNAVVLEDRFIPQNVGSTEKHNSMEKRNQSSSITELMASITTTNRVADAVVLLLSFNSKCLNDQLFFVDADYAFEEDKENM